MKIVIFVALLFAAQLRAVEAAPISLTSGLLTVEAPVLYPKATHLHLEGTKGFVYNGWIGMQFYKFGPVDTWSDGDEMIDVRLVRSWDDMYQRFRVDGVDHVGGYGSGYDNHAGMHLTITGTGLLSDQFIPFDYRLWVWYSTPTGERSSNLMIGSGLVSLAYGDDGFESAQYQFDPSLVSMPEPSTLLLLAPLLLRTTIRRYKQGFLSTERKRTSTKESRNAVSLS